MKYPDLWLGTTDAIEVATDAINESPSADCMYVCII